MINIAALWDAEVAWGGDGPFVADHLNNSYLVFAEMAREHGAETFIANYAWYEDGRLTKAYHATVDGWEQVEDIPVTVVFDKYKYTEETLPLKQEIEDTHPVLNALELETLTKDKLLTYETFPEYVPETKPATEETVHAFLDRDGRAVVKPRFAHGGEGVEVIESLDAFEPGDDLLVQRFVDSRHGITELGIEGVHDLRIVGVDHDPVAAYVRTPESGFISNVSRGGSMTHIPIEDVPTPAMDVFDVVTEKLSQYAHCVYAVDLIFDVDQKPWILELNSKPGMSFYDDPAVAAWKRPWMNRVVDALVALGQSIE